MRRIVTFRLKTGNSINVIADTKSDKEAKQIAIEILTVLLGIGVSIWQKRWV